MHTSESAHVLLAACFALVPSLRGICSSFCQVRLADDLFIIDQHAADEKYTFETLQASTTLHT